MTCPCGRPQDYDLCCGRFHRGQAEAPTAERLMRARYSAYAVGDAAYVLRTWHPSTRPVAVETGEGWLRLEVLGATGGGLLDADGTVRFRAHATDGVVVERSRFVRHEGRWTYLDGA